MQEYPVVTQTFVENEALALEALGFRVTRYPLRRTGKGRREQGVVTFGSVLLNPRRWLALAWSLGAFYQRRSIIKSVVRAEKIKLGDLSRQFYALLHALAVDAYVRSESDQVHYVHAHFLGRCSDVSVFARILALDRATRFSATGHAGDVTNPGTPNRLRVQMKYLDGVVCASKAVGGALERATGREATGIVHCGIRPASMTSRRKEGGPIRILSVGRLVEKKGFQDAVAAGLQMAEMGRDFEWRIIGAGPLENELVSSSKQLVASGRLDWLGAQSSHVVLSLLNSWADIFVLPCRTASDGDADGIPVALMEAMTAGVPVVSSRVAGIPELISSGITGYLIEPGDVQALVDYICHLSDFDNERAKMAVAAKSFVDREFNLELEAAKMAQILFHPVPDVDPLLVGDK